MEAYPAFWHCKNYSNKNTLNCVREMDTKLCAAAAKRTTYHCMTDARKYCKMPYLTMLRKVEN